jgi:outer membrane protein assembly factor BamB
MKASMKKKIFPLLGLLIGLSLLLGGCATGLTPGAWPTVVTDGEMAYIAGGGFVYAVDLQTRAEIWRFPDKASTASPFYATPAITPDGHLIVGGFNHVLYSLDPQTGEEITTFTGARDKWIGGMLLTDERIFAGNADYNLYALDLDLNLQWSFQADQSIWGAPVTDGTNIYFGSLGRKLYAVDAERGELAWVRTLDGAVLGSPVIGPDGTLYVGTYGSLLYALDPRDGSTLWSDTVSSWVWNGPTLFGDRLLVGDGSGDLISLPLDGGPASWTESLNGMVIGSPVVMGETILVGTDESTLYLLNGDGGDIRPFSVSGKVHSTPVLAGDQILVPLTDGEALLAVLDADGALLWSFEPEK